MDVLELPPMLQPLFVLLTVLLPARVLAAPVLDLPASVRSGDRLELRWGALPSGVREVELELSLGGGRWLRVSPELEAGAREFLWQVPARLGASARLRLRAGGDVSEGVIATSRSFAILCDELLRDPRGAGIGDWWQVDARTRATAAGLDARGPTLHGLAEPLPAEPAPRSQHSLAAVTRARTAGGGHDFIPPLTRRLVPPVRTPSVAMRL